VASLVLLFLFVTMLGSTKPSSPGQQVPLSQVGQLTKAKVVSRATLLDHDSRVVLTTTNGRTLWAAYPSSDVATDNLRLALQRSGAEVSIDQQASKGTRIVVVQFLLPILLLVCLFALFTRLGQDDGASGFAAFSKFTGSARKKRKGGAGITFDQVAGAGEAVAELREIRDRPLQRHGRAGAEGRAARRASRHRQDAPGARDGG
jgi:cell division protease FtsH